MNNWTITICPDILAFASYLVPGMSTRLCATELRRTSYFVPDITRQACSSLTKVYEGTLLVSCLVVCIPADIIRTNERTMIIYIDGLLPSPSNLMIWSAGLESWNAAFFFVEKKRLAILGACWELAGLAGSAWSAKRYSYFIGKVRCLFLVIHLGPLGVRGELRSTLSDNVIPGTLGTLGVRGEVLLYHLPGLLVKQ